MMFFNRSFLVSQILPVFLLHWLLLISRLTPVSGAGNNGLCEEMCDKYRSHNGAYALKCKGRDSDCTANCRYCDASVCDSTQSQVVYHCPSKYRTVLIVVLSSLGIFLLVATCLFCLFFLVMRKYKNGALTLYETIPPPTKG